MKYTIEELDAMEGHDFEHAVADLLRHNGYREVRATQASGDYGIDILARRKNVRYAIQCKRWKGPVGNKAVQEAGLGTDFYHCDAAAVITNSTFTKQAIKLAAGTGVRLWDRNFLLELIKNYDYDEEEAVSSVKNTASKPSPAIPQKTSGKTTLDQGIYLENGKIHIGKDTYTYMAAERLRIFMLCCAWFFIILGIILTSASPKILGAAGIFVGICTFVYANRLKTALDQYLRLRIQGKAP